MSMNRFDTDHLKIFFAMASVFDIEKFCKENGYCVVIASPDNFWVEKEMFR